jgi:hypothetical protein
MLDERLMMQIRAYCIAHSDERSVKGAEAVHNSLVDGISQNPGQIGIQGQVESFREVEIEFGGRNGAIDLVILSPRGVYAVETRYMKEKSYNGGSALNAIAQGWDRMHDQLEKAHGFFMGRFGVNSRLIGVEKRETIPGIRYGEIHYEPAQQEAA